MSFVLCCALLSVDIWCTRVTMRCNRFSVLGSVVLPCALSCDCGAFYKCLPCCRLMIGRFARSCRAVGVGVGVACAVLVCAVICFWREDGAYWL